MRTKEIKRKKRAYKTRQKIKNQNQYRLTIDKSHNHTTAQVISPDDKTICSATTREQSIKEECQKAGVKHFGNKEAAKIVGQVIAERARQNNITDIALDRSGYTYHGRIETLAQNARNNGLNF